MLKHEAAAYLAGLTSEDSSNTADPTNVHVISGEVSGTSEDGKVLVAIDGMMFSEDDDQYVEVDALGGLEDGDVVTILLTGESGHGMAPFALGTSGTVDRVKSLASSASEAAELAQETADAAQEVAEATNQHFFSDENGIHVTEETQEDWNADHTGANVLINSIGQLFRDGLNNLLTLTTENGARALTVWDGLGNTSDHIRAIIGETIQLGNADSGNYMTLDDTGVEIYNDSKTDGYSAMIGPAIVRLLGDRFNIETVIDGGMERTYFDSVISHTVGKTSFIQLRTSQHKYIESDVVSSITLHADAIILDGITTGKRLIASGNAKVALAASTNSDSMNRGLWDETGGKWIIYQHTSYGIVLGNSVTDTLYKRTATCTINTTNATIANNVNYCWNNSACCSVAIGINLKASMANNNLLEVATAPSGYRPPHTFYGSAYVTGQTVNLQTRIDEDGKIYVNNRSGSTVNTSANIYLSFTFAP